MYTYTHIKSIYTLAYMHMYTHMHTHTHSPPHTLTIDIGGASYL